MLFHLLAPLGERYILFNPFNYITFRTAGAGVTAIIMAFVVGPPIIRRLEAKRVGQVIRSEGPASHQSKRGTPTMGGIIILLSTLVPTLLWARLDNRYVIIAALAMVWMGCIGFIDDYLKSVSGKSRGLIAKYKLVGQITFGIGLGSVLLLAPSNMVFQATDTIVPGNAITLPFFKYVVIMLHPIVYLGFVTIVTTGASNSVNLTDGLDGLATGLTAIAAATLAIFAYLFGRVDTSAYLLVPYLEGAGELTIFCAALAGAALGFLWYNAHPAHVFMGDTGSLAIGGALGTVGILLKSEFLLLLVAGVFVAETVSVILQTGTYKWNKRRRGRAYADQHRLFRMAPLHHHFEHLGWPESQIVTRFYIAGILFALLALSTLKLR